MLIRFMILVLLALSVGCSHNEVRSERGRFNQLAAVTFSDNSEKYDLGSLHDFEKCILHETIANDLDKMNDWRTVTIENRFQVRTYHTPYLDLDFAFVKYGDRFSFITLPDVVKHIYDIRDHYQEAGNDWILKDSSAVYTINSTLLNGFLNDSIAAIKKRSVFEKATLLNRLLPEIFYSPFFRSISLYQFKDMLDEQINAGEMKNDDYNKIRKLIEPVHPSVVNLSCIFFLERVGWILLNYPEENLEGNKVKVDAYFIAVRKRSSIVHGEEHIKYFNCL